MRMGCGIIGSSMAIVSAMATSVMASATPANTALDNRLALALYLKLEHPNSSSSIEEESLTDFTTLAPRIRRS